MFISFLFIKENLEISLKWEKLSKVRYMKYYISIKTMCNNLDCWQANSYRPMAAADLPKAST